MPPSPTGAAANVAAIRQMISQSNTWRDIATPANASAVRRKVSAAAAGLEER